MLIVEMMVEMSLTFGPLHEVQNHLFPFLLLVLRGHVVFPLRLCTVSIMATLSEQIEVFDALVSSENTYDTLPQVLKAGASWRTPAQVDCSINLGWTDMEHNDRSNNGHINLVWITMIATFCNNMLAQASKLINLSTMLRLVLMFMMATKKVPKLSP